MLTREKKELDSFITRLVEQEKWKEEVIAANSQLVAEALETSKKGGMQIGVYAAGYANDNPAVDRPKQEIDSNGRPLFRTEWDAAKIFEMLYNERGVGKVLYDPYDHSPSNLSRWKDSQPRRMSLKSGRL